VAVGRAIVKKPEVFLFDEPLSNLDAKLRASMRVRLTDLHRTLREAGQPATVVYVTHDQVEAMTMGERICVLKDGVLQQVDTPTTLYDRPANAFVAGFIGSPEMNIHEGKLQEQEGRLGVTIGALWLPLPADKAAALAHHRGAVKLGLRPEHISLAASPHGACSEAMAQLRSLEHMGNEVFVHFSLGAQDWTARVGADALHGVQHRRRGEPHTVHLQLAACHVFDAASGMRLC
jgi:oligogalacturonide transport system ATP-binding protein